MTLTSTSRRAWLRGALAAGTAAATGSWASLSLAGVANPGDRRLVFVVLRGGMERWNQIGLEVEGSAPDR